MPCGVPGALWSSITIVGHILHLPAGVAYGLNLIKFGVAVPIIGVLLLFSNRHSVFIHLTNLEFALFEIGSLNPAMASLSFSFVKELLPAYPSWSGAPTFKVLLPGLHPFCWRSTSFFEQALVVQSMSRRL
jgi:hypothetical protein